MKRYGFISQAVSLILVLTLVLPYPAAVAAEGQAVSTKFTHETPDTFIPGFRIIMNASISDASGIKEARCYFRTKGTEDFIFVNMQGVGEAYKAVIPAPELGSKSLSYFFLSLNGTRQVERTQVYEISEKNTAEAKDLNEAETAKAKGDNIDLDSLKDRLMDRLEKKYKDSLKKSQIAKKDSVIKAGTDMEKAPAKATGFSDKVEIVAAQPDSRLSLVQVGTTQSAATASAAGTTATTASAGEAAATPAGAAAATGAAAAGGVSTLGLVIGGLAVIAGGAAVAGGGGGGGGGGRGGALDLSGAWCTTFTETGSTPGSPISIFLTKTAPDTYSWSGLVPDDQPTPLVPLSLTFTVSGTSLTIQAVKQGIACGTTTGTARGSTDGNTFTASGPFTHTIPCGEPSPQDITASGLRGSC